MSTPGYITFMTVLVVLSAYFSATETAFSSLSRTKLRALAEEKNKAAALALALSEKYDRLISTILIGNNVVNITLSSLGTLFFTRELGAVGATVSTVVVTLVVLIFGEITPKSIAKDFPERFAMFSAPALNILIKLLLPLNFIFSLWKSFVSRLFKQNEDEKLSQKELLMMVEEATDEEENEIICNAIEFTDRRAEDILTPRMDIEAIAIDSPKEEIAQTFFETRFSRLPVYEENLDSIVGVLHQKDFYSGMGITEKPISEIMTEAVFIGKTEPIRDLLETLKKKKAQVAVVVDEFGGTLGIVTMEDILEELVGDIWDEHDEVLHHVSELEENKWSIECSITLADFCDRFDLTLECDKLSLGGWVTEMLGKIGEVGDSFVYEDLTVTVTEADERKVIAVCIEKDPEKAKGEDDKDER